MQNGLARKIEQDSEKQAAKNQYLKKSIKKAGFLHTQETSLKFQQLKKNYWWLTVEAVLAVMVDETRLASFVLE